MFQRSWAALTFRSAVACVNGGRGGLVDEGVVVDMVRWWGLVVRERERDGCWSLSLRGDGVLVGEERREVRVEVVLYREDDNITLSYLLTPSV